MDILCAFPSLNRSEGVSRLMESIGDVVDVSVKVEVTPRALPVIYQEILEDHQDHDVIVLLADYLVVRPGCFDAIEAAFEKHFPDFDGVVGLNMENMPPNPNVAEFCFVALGSRFMDRFPERQCHCPDYYHFYADTELGLYAKSINKFVFEEEARVFSYHPNAKNAERDSTHQASRRFKAEDMGMWNRRNAQGLLWGADFELINEEPA